MKIRDGHVSNSSSSSFIFALPKRPDSPKELMEMLYPGQKDDDPLAHLVPVARAAEFIFRGMEEITFCPTCKRRNESDDSYWHEKIDPETVTKFIKQNPDRFYYEINLSDDGGSFEGELEHGPTFEGIPHVRESHH